MLPVFEQHYDCRNHVRVIQPIEGNKLYVCGTNAHAPRDWVLHVMPPTVPFPRPNRALIAGQPVPPLRELPWYRRRGRHRKVPLRPGRQCDRLMGR